METTQAKIMRIESADRISALPDALIHHILSFTGMKYAVQTSALSSRWRYFWTSLPFLNFDSLEFQSCTNLALQMIPSGNEDQDRFMKDHDRFMKFVDKVLMARGTSDILKFSLVDNTQQGIPPERLHLWIISAVRHNVQELHLSIDTNNQHLQLPHLLFSCKSLVKLKTSTKLNLHRANNFLTKVPDFYLHVSMKLSKLKTLDLSKVCFTDQNLTDKLFSISTCPVLESLALEYSVGKSVRNINIVTPQLKHLIIKRCLLGKQSACMIRIHAPNLISLTVNDYIVIHYDLCPLQSLDSADINLILLKFPGRDHNADKKLYVGRALMFLLRVCNARTLTLSPSLLELVKEETFFSKESSQRLELFSNLRHLKLYTWLTSDGIMAIMSILKASPNLSSLVLITEICVPGGSAYIYFEKEMSNSGSLEEYQVARQSLPFMLPQLKSVEVRDVRGTVNELKMVEYLLQTAFVLEKLILYKVSTQSTERKKSMIKFSEKLLTFPRASLNTTIFLLD